MPRRVVITGMGVVSPNGVGKEAFCRAVLAGTSGVKRITKFDTSDLPVQIAGQALDFEESKWISAHERKHVSRVVPLSIAASAEALVDARLEPGSMSKEEKREIGVILGTGGGAQDFSEEQYRTWYEGNRKAVSLFVIPNGTMGSLCSEISMRFGFRGLSHVITTGCTSSTDALGYALRNIQAGVLSMVLTGGADAPVTWGIMKGFSFMKIMTARWNEQPERGSRPFSADRDGFVLAEGAWMFVLEEYEHARARGAHIYAEVAGYGSTCEAFHRVRLDDNGEEPARAIGLSMQEAGIEAADVQYVNLHGTSTELNDRIETRALKIALDGRAY
ncbi:MAG: beta-ketoacyl-[acyl-carrier-protein] synthase family protein, partial [Burkholderiales bacterium]